MSGAERSTSFTSDRGGWEALARAVGQLAAAMADTQGNAAFSGVATEVLAAQIAQLEPCPKEPVPFDEVVGEVAMVLGTHGVNTTAGTTLAHLHSPTMTLSAATDAVISAANQSLDSYDQSPAATLVEDHLLSWLGGELGMEPGCAGVMTAGGTGSNVLALTLAREAAARRLGHSTVFDGLPAAASSWRIVTGEKSHFSIQRAAALLGLGHKAVVPVASVTSGAIDLDALDAVLEAEAARGHHIIAIVGTAGTTDLGSIDPLAELADRAEALGAWFHVDGAVASAFILSDRLAPRLAGIGRADSVTVDFHKLFWQPIAASALVVAGGERSFDLLRVPSAYLDRDEDRAEGVLNLVGRSLDTTRRADALKVLVGLRTTGRAQFGAMVERLVDLAEATAGLVEATEGLELVVEPSSVTVLFRYRGEVGDPERLDAINTAIQRTLFTSGQAVVGRTLHGGRQVLKFTFVNPELDLRAVEATLERIAVTGHQLAT